jgi:selenocysteine-specific elongation factor
MSAAGNGSAVLIDEELLAALAHQRRIVRVSEDLAFTAQAYDQMVDQVVGHLKAHGKITVAEVRDLFGTSRRYVLALLEHLDRERVTRRVGDERVLAVRQ